MIYISLQIRGKTQLVKVQKHSQCGEEKDDLIGLEDQALGVPSGFASGAIFGGGAVTFGPGAAGGITGAAPASYIAAAGA